MTRKLLQAILRFLASAVLKKYQPEIIGITGSVGKTSTKEAIYSVLAGHFRVRRSIGNYNNEIGAPLTILGVLKTGGKNPFRWLAIFIKAFGLLMFSDDNYPEILILEMGADKPGDIKYLLSFIPIKIGVLTAVGQVHLEAFGTVEKVLREKSLLITELPKDGLAVLNYDMPDVLSLADKTKAQAVTYGFGEGADAQAVEIAAAEQEISAPLSGVNFKLVFQGSAVPIHLPKVLGKSQVYAALAGAALGIAKGLNLIRISENLRQYSSPPGRMKLIAGIKGTQIIDDTYNASPLSVITALEEMKSICLSEGNKKYAILGDMLELGTYTVEGHRRVGLKAAEIGVDVLIAVGSLSLDIVKAAKETGMPEERIFHFGAPEEAGRFVQERIKSGDLILVKGSRKMRMEKVVKELMSEPLKAEELLVH